MSFRSFHEGLYDEMMQSSRGRLIAVAMAVAVPVALVLTWHDSGREVSTRAPSNVVQTQPPSNVSPVQPGVSADKSKIIVTDDDAKCVWDAFGGVNLGRFTKEGQPSNKILYRGLIDSVAYYRLEVNLPRDSGDTQNFSFYFDKEIRVGFDDITMRYYVAEGSFTTEQTVPMTGVSPYDTARIFITIDKAGKITKEVTPVVSNSYPDHIMGDDDIPGQPAVMKARSRLTDISSNVVACARKVARRLAPQ